MWRKVGNFPFRLILHDRAMGAFVMSYPSSGSIISRSLVVKHTRIQGHKRTTRTFSSHPANSNIAHFTSPVSNPSWEGLFRNSKLMKIVDFFPTQCRTSLLLGSHISTGKTFNRKADHSQRHPVNPQLTPSANPVDVPRNAGFVFHSDTCNEMFIFFPFLFGDGNHRWTCCGKS